MERLLVIILAASIGTGFYYWFSWMVKKESMRDYVFSHFWLLHPNSICYWRTAMALTGYYLYFWTSWQSLAIIIFTFAAILDGVDGVVARQYGLVTKWGESLDPMCDKLTYLPPLISFAYLGVMSTTLIWVLVAVELFGQFFARRSYPISAIQWQPITLAKSRRSSALLWLSTAPCSMIISSLSTWAMRY